MEMKRYQFSINTSNICFLCFDVESIINGEPANDYLKLNIKSPSHSIQNVFRYLNIDLRKVQSLSKKFLPLLNRTDVRVNLCFECSQVMERFAEHYKAMEISRMKLEFTLKAVQEKLLKMANENYPNLLEEYQKKIKKNDLSNSNETETQARKHLKLVEELRRTILKKCNSRINKFQPRPRIKREMIKIVNAKAESNIVEEDANNLNLPEDEYENDESYCPTPSPSPVPSPPSSTAALAHTGSGTSVSPTQQEVNPQPELASVQHLEYSNLKKKVSSCDGCGVVYCRMDFLEKHKQKCNNGTKPKGVAATAKIAIKIKSKKQKRRLGEYICRFCPKSFKSQNTHHRHEKIHIGKGLTCTVCKKIFGGKYDLKNHQKTHTGEKPFECQTCGKRFALKHNFDAHLRQIPTSCYLYSEQQTRIGSTGAYDPNKTSTKRSSPQKCEICLKVYFDRGSLIRHMKRWHPPEGVENPFKCGLCNESYSRRYGLKIHMKKTHKRVLSDDLYTVDQAALRRKIDYVKNRRQHEPKNKLVVVSLSSTSTDSVPIVKSERGDIKPN